MNLKPLPKKELAAPLSFEEAVKQIDAQDEYSSHRKKVPNIDYDYQNDPEEEQFTHITTRNLNNVV